MTQHVSYDHSAAPAAPKQHTAFLTGWAPPPPFPPMEALSVDEIPTGEEWQYEPKWDGFRCLVFRNGDKVELQSKSGQSLTRYFPELVEAARSVKAKSFVL